MKLYIDNATNSLVTSATITTTPTITLFKEDISSVEIRFVENGLGVDIGTPAIRLGLGKDGVLIGFTDSWTKNGTGATAYWTGNFNLNTQQAEMVLAGLSSTEAILEVEVRQGGAVATKAQLSVTLKTDLINETDTATDIGNIVTLGATHIASTTNVHGIANTADLLTGTALTTHSNDTTAVHGITDTSNLNSIIAGSGATLTRTIQTGNPEDPTEEEDSYDGGDGGTINIRGGNGGWYDEGGAVGANAGSINLKGGNGSDGAGGSGGSILLVGNVDGANAGSINLSGGSGGVGHGGSIISTGANGDHHNGGTLNMSANGDGDGGSINTSYNGGSINTSGYDTHMGGGIDLRAEEYGAGGSINGSNNGGSIIFSGTKGRVGGSISLNAGTHASGASTIGLGGVGGLLQLKGGNGNEETNFGNGGNGGTILGNGAPPPVVGSDANSEAILGTGFNAGTINFSAGYLGAGGSIDISNGGGSINTRGVGSIELGVTGTRTTLNGSASATNKTITLPNETGVIALTPQIPYGGIISASAVDAFSGAGTYPMIQGSGVGGSIQVASNGTITIASAGTGYVDGLATRAGGSRFNLVTQATQYASANLPIITKAGGGITTGSFGTTANTFCQGNDVRLNSVFDLYQVGVDIGRTTAWHQQITIPSNITELLNGSPAIVTDVACIITNRSGTGSLFVTPPSFQLSNGTDSASLSYASSLSIGIKPLVGNYSRTSNGVGVANSDGKYTYTGGSLFIQSATLPSYLSANLSGAMTPTQTTMAVSPQLAGGMGGGVFSGSGTYVKIDNEIVFITNGGGSLTPTIVRGQLGTASESHNGGAVVSANIGSAGGGLLVKVCYTFKRFVG